MENEQEDRLKRIKDLEVQNQELQSRLEEAQETLRAISKGEVDALVVYDDYVERVYTLQGADYAFRVMVESIHEGAANITNDGMILYCNKQLAEMLKMPLERVLGSSFHTYLPEEEQATFAALAHKGLEKFGKGEFHLLSTDTNMPVLITASAAEVNGRRGICLVVTDLTEQKQATAREKELQRRLTEQREEERVRIARNLHDGPLQDIIGLSFTLQELIATNGSGKLPHIRERMLKLAGDLRTVCNELRPPSTVRFGLTKAIRYQSDEIRANNPDLSINLQLSEDDQSIPKEIVNALFRIFIESMNNVVRHSGATSVEVRLLTDQKSILMEVQDNGHGFKPPEDWVELARQGHLGLVGMRERAEAIGGKLRILPGPDVGTTIQVETPCELKNT